MDAEIHELLTFLIGVVGTPQEDRARQRLWQSINLLT